MNEAETRTEHIDPALAKAGWGAVNRLKTELGTRIQVDLLMKNNDGSHKFYRAGVDQIDNHIPEK